MTRTVRAAAAALLAGGALAGAGCMSADRPTVQDRYYGVVDPCWPERYSHQARESVLGVFDQEVASARVLDHTLMNYYFEDGTDKLTPLGRVKLDAIARKRGDADGRLYLQTARDLPFDVNHPDKLVNARAELDQKRGQAVLAYMAVQPSAQTVSYQVLPIDPTEPGINVQGPANALRGLPTQYHSTLTGAVSGVLQGAGGQAAVGTIGTTPNSGQGQGGGSGGVPNSGNPGSGTPTR